MRPVGNDAKRLNPLLLVALLCASLVLMTVYYREGERGPLHTVRSGLLAATKPVVSAGHWVTTPIRWARSGLGGLTVSREEVATLRDQNEKLRRRNAELEEAALENERLRALVGFAEKEKYDTLGAHIIGRPLNAWEGAITIDRGAGDGVAVGMPVVGSQGLLGQVVAVSSGSARVRLITDQRSGVAALVQRTRGTGIVRGSVEGELRLDFVERTAMPKVGDVIVTSGMGGVYPKSLPIGEVVSVEARPSDLFPKIVLAPAVPFEDIEEVTVLRSGAPVVEVMDPE